MGSANADLTTPGPRGRRYWRFVGQRAIVLGKMAQLAPGSDVIDAKDECKPPRGADDVDVQFPFSPIIPTPVSPSAPQDALASPAPPFGHNLPHAQSEAAAAAAMMPGHDAGSGAHPSAAAVLMLRHVAGPGGVRQRRRTGGALQHFNGKSVLCCKGACVLGPASSYKTVSASVMLISIPSATNSQKFSI